MTNPGNEAGMAEFKAAVDLFYDKVRSGKMNYFELLGIPTNATHKDIESAYAKFSSEFSEAKAASLTSPELKMKTEYLVKKGKRAFELLTDFEKRGTYERMGFKDVDPASLKEEEPSETARKLYQKAKSLFGVKQFETAVKALEEANRLDPNKPDYLHLLGVSQGKIPRYKRDAEKNLLKAAELESWNAEHQAALGMLFYSERLFKRAEGFFQKAIELEPGHSVAGKKLREIRGPEVKPMDKAKKTLGKIFPTFFGKK